MFFFFFFKKKVDKNLNVKIGDFGLSRIKANNATMTRCGTVAWTAPEILKGIDYTEKSDVYSFGIVLWEM
jgi:serine/threonine protein kinase